MVQHTKPSSHICTIQSSAYNYLQAYTITYYCSYTVNKILIQAVTIGNARLKGEPLMRISSCTTEKLSLHIPE